MEELLGKLKDACAGLTAEEIAAQVSASQYADQIGDVEQFGRFLAALCQVGNPTEVAPDQAESAEDAGKD